MRQARGFSLLETVAAMLLLALAFTALMQVVGGAMRLAGNAGDYSRAALCARSVLDTAFVLEPVRAGNWNGRLADDCRWRLAVRPWQAQTQTPGTDTAAPIHPLRLYRLDLAVQWGARDHERTARFSTLRVASAPPVGNASP